MPKVEINFSQGAKPPPDSSSLLIVGNIRHLQALKYNDIKVKLHPVVTEETYTTALKNLRPNPSDSCSLYLNSISIAAFADKATHYNSSAQPHLLTEIIKSFSKSKPILNIVIVCEKKDIFASGTAVAKTFPTFSKKTIGDQSKKGGSEKLEVVVEFLIAQDGQVINVFNSEAVSDKYAELKSVLETLNCVSFGIQLAAKIVDTPCNEMNVDDFIEEIKCVGNQLNIVPVIIRGEELKERGFGGIYGVGRGAAIPPALVILSYRVPNATENIAWVGKGIVYDTGGLCIKGRASMPGMKRDCGGAAAVLGAFYAAVKLGFTENLHAVFCLAENAVGPLATKPDDIHTLYSGKTVEINNTDAEGRLVLADGVVYAKRDLKANTIVDVATLTGAQSVSTGKHHGAVMSNHQKWEQLAVDSGLISGDLAFPIIYCPELYFQEYSSDVADMKNSVADRTNALSSCAGLFMAAHLGFDPNINWVHMDIAGVSYLGERATGYGVSLLNVMFGNHSKDANLKYLCPTKDSHITNCDSHSNKRRKT